MADPTPVHKSKKSKNRILLAILFALAALIWVLTMVKMGMQ